MAAEKITYLYGSTATKLEPSPQKKTNIQVERPLHTGTQRQTRVRTKASPMNVPLFVLSLVTFALIGFMMIQYISLSSEIAMLSNNITKLERQVNTLKLENDEHYGRIMSSVDLEKVREVAIMDLGMVYASEDQVITYDSQIDDYVEQRNTIGNE